jgi:hypothetical protein
MKENDSSRRSDDMGNSLAGIKSDYKSEIRSRKEKREREQSISDASEIRRRLQLVKEGKDGFYGEEETEAMLRALGYYES